MKDKGVSVRCNTSVPVIHVYASILVTESLGIVQSDPKRDQNNSNLQSYWFT